MKTLKYIKGHPQVANVAINQSKNLAKNFKWIIRGKVPVDYEYRDLGSMAYCLEKDILLKRKIALSNLPQIGDIVGFVNTAK